MVGSGAGLGSEGGVGEQKILAVVDEDTIKADQRGAFASTGPGELPLEERNLNEGECVDSVIKPGHLIGMEVAGIILLEEPGEIGITKDHPGLTIGRSKEGKVMQESSLSAWTTGAYTQV